MLLKDRISIVTGGSSGIGRGIALEFAREGASVVIADKQESPLQGKYHEKDATTPTVQEIEKIGTHGIFINTDVSDESQVAEMLQQTVEHFGGLDILVNNAGIHIPGGSQDISVADWDKVVGVNSARRFPDNETCHTTFEKVKIWTDYPNLICPRLWRWRGASVCLCKSCCCEYG